MKEIQIIEYIQTIFPRHKLQKNSCFESDCEFIELNGKNYAFNIDDYSPEEDFFTDYNPEILGYNLATATISDLFAAGAAPEFYLHSISFPKTKDENYVKLLLKGIANALSEAKMFLLGGDTSFADNWKYTGVAFGEAKKMIKRSNASVNDIIYATAKFGSGNRQALLKFLIDSKMMEKSPKMIDMASPCFVLRDKEAKVINKYCSFATDSSDGYLNSFLNLQMVNKDLGFEILFDKTLVEDDSIALSKKLNLDPEMFLVSSAGEYELIFGVPMSAAYEFEKEMNLKQLPFTKIGNVVNKQGIKLIVEKDGVEFKEVECNIKDIPDPRNLENYEYLDKLKAFVKKLKSKI